MNSIEQLEEVIIGSFPHISLIICQADDVIKEKMKKKLFEFAACNMEELDELSEHDIEIMQNVLMKIYKRNGWVK